MSRKWLEVTRKWLEIVGYAICHVSASIFPNERELFLNNQYNVFDNNTTKDFTSNNNNFSNNFTNSLLRFLLARSIESLQFKDDVKLKANCQVLFAFFTKGVPYKLKCDFCNEKFYG